MKKTILLLACALMGLSLSAQTYTWRAAAMDGSRTGVKASNADNVDETMGTIKGGRYHAPNGKTFKKGKATFKVAKIMLDAQDQMAPLKTVVGHSKNGMRRGGSDSPLGNWSCDALLDIAEAEFGRRPDFSVLNGGGIRIEMPVGDVLLDDIKSMFPFKNTVVLVELKGSDVRIILENMARRNFQPLGGVRVVAEDGELKSVEIAGSPLDDDKVYTMATISFLLGSGDGLYLGNNAISVNDCGKYLGDMVVEYVKELDAKGITLDAEPDGRVQMLGFDPRRPPMGGPGGPGGPGGQGGPGSTGGPDGQGGQRGPRPEGALQGVPQGASQGAQPGVPQGLPQGSPQGFPPQTPTISE